MTLYLLGITVCFFNVTNTFPMSNKSPVDYLWCPRGRLTRKRSPISPPQLTRRTHTQTHTHTHTPRRKHQRMTEQSDCGSVCTVCRSSRDVASFCAGVLYSVFLFSFFFSSFWIVLIETTSILLSKTENTGAWVKWTLFIYNEAASKNIQRKQKITWEQFCTRALGDFRLDHYVFLHVIYILIYIYSYIYIYI